MVRNLSLSRRRLGGSGGTKVRYVACCFFVTFLFLLSIYKARSIYGGKIYQKTQRTLGGREHFNSNARCFPETSVKCQAQQLDELLTSMSAEGRFKASVGARNKSEEAYATILYSKDIDSDFYMYACAAASLGLALKQIDPSRPRVALVTGLTEEAREILSDGDIWQLIDVPQWPAASVGGLPSSLAFGRKAALWDLVSYKRVFFIDSDTFIVPDNSGQRLKRLESIWELEPLGKWHPYTFRTGKGRARAHDVKYNCIQSSHMLLEPASEVAERYRAILQDPPSLQFTDCIGQDQKVISYLFPFSLMLPIDLWRTSKYSGKECDVVLGEDPAVDEIHIFLHRFREEKKKVQPFWGGDCTSCILEGKRCRYSNAFTQPCHKIIIDWWWGRMMQLPSTTLNRCLKHHGANLHNVDQACYVV